MTLEDHILKLPGQAFFSGFVSIIGSVVWYLPMPWFFVTFFILGFAAGVLNVYRTISRLK